MSETTISKKYDEVNESEYYKYVDFLCNEIQKVNINLKKPQEVDSKRLFVQKFLLLYYLLPKTNHEKFDDINNIRKVYGFPNDIFKNIKKKIEQILKTKKREHRNLLENNLFNKFAERTKLITDLSKKKVKQIENNSLIEFEKYNTSAFEFQTDHFHRDTQVKFIFYLMNKEKIFDDLDCACESDSE